MHEMQVRPLCREDPLERKWQPTREFLLGKFCEQGSLASHDLWGHKRIKHDLVRNSSSLLLILCLQMGVYAHRCLTRPLLQDCAWFKDLLYYIICCGQGWLSLPYTEWSWCKEAGRVLPRGKSVRHSPCMVMKARSWACWETLRRSRWEIPEMLPL